jgi:hypothetical protein
MTISVRIVSLIILGVLERAADVYKCEADLEDNEGVGVIVPSPDDPEHVAQQEQPESPVTFELSLRANHPRGNDGHCHGGPLDPIKHH